MFSFPKLKRITYLGHIFNENKYLWGKSLNDHMVLLQKLNNTFDNKQGREN